MQFSSVIGVRTIATGVDTTLTITSATFNKVCQQQRQQQLYYSRCKQQLYRTANDCNN